METEVKLVHPSDPDKKVITGLTDIQVAAYKSNGFVEESELKAPESQTSPADVEELAKLKAEVKALKSENTRLKNKLEKVSTESGTPNPEDEANSPETGTESEGEKDEIK